MGERFLCCLEPGLSATRFVVYVVCACDVPSGVFQRHPLLIRNEPLRGRPRALTFEGFQSWTRSDTDRAMTPPIAAPAPSHSLVCRSCILASRGAILHVLRRVDEFVTPFLCHETFTAACEEEASVHTLAFHVAPAWKQAVQAATRGHLTYFV